jgi:hypothetical protein
MQQIIKIINEYPRLHNTGFTREEIIVLCDLCGIENHQNVFRAMGAVSVIKQDNTILYSARDVESYIITAHLE